MAEELDPKDLQDFLDYALGEGLKDRKRPLQDYQDQFLRAETIYYGDRYMPKKRVCIATARIELGAAESSYPVVNEVNLILRELQEYIEYLVADHKEVNPDLYVDIVGDTDEPNRIRPPQRQRPEAQQVHNSLERLTDLITRYTSHYEEASLRPTTEQWRDVMEVFDRLYHALKVLHDIDLGGRLPWHS